MRNTSDFPKRGKVPVLTPEPLLKKEPACSRNPCPQPEHKLRAAKA
jgi:hypothetical protein